MHAAFNDSGGDGEAGQAGDIVNIQFFHEMLTMLFDGLDADAKFRGDLFVHMPLGNQLQQLGFARSQLGLALFLQADSIGRFLVIVF